MVLQASNQSSNQAPVPFSPTPHCCAAAAAGCCVTLTTLYCRTEAPRLNTLPTRSCLGTLGLIQAPSTFVPWAALKHGCTGAAGTNARSEQATDGVESQSHTHTLMPCDSPATPSVCDLKTHHPRCQPQREQAGACLTGAQVCDGQVAASITRQLCVSPRYGQVLHRHLTGRQPPKHTLLAHTLQLQNQVACKRQARGGRGAQGDVEVGCAGGYSY